MLSEQPFARPVGLTSGERSDERSLQCSIERPAEEVAEQPGDVMAARHRVARTLEQVIGREEEFQQQRVGEERAAEKL